jgi:hypothetical protein
MLNSATAHKGKRSFRTRASAGTARRARSIRASSRRVLLAALGPDPGELPALAAALADRLDWDWILDRARTHKVAALLAARLDHLEDGLLPNRVRDTVGTVQREARERATRAQRTLQQVARALAARSVPFLVLKGSVLAERVYGDPALRPFHDVDLVVPVPRLDEAEAALVSLGYRFYCPPASAFDFVPPAVRPSGAPEAPVPESVARLLYRTHHYHFGYVPPRGDERLPVELHWHVAEPSVLPVPPAALWERATPTVVAGLPMQTLDAEAMLVHVALHAMKDGRAMFRLLHLCDVAWLVARERSRDGWERTIALAAAWRTHHHLARAVEAARRLFRLPSAAGPPPPGLAAPLLRSCFRLSGDPVGGGRGHGPLGRLTREILTEALWDLSLGRLPRRAERRVLATARVRLARWGLHT